MRTSPRPRTKTWSPFFRRAGPARNHPCRRLLQDLRPLPHRWVLDSGGHDCVSRPIRTDKEARNGHHPSRDKCIRCKVRGRDPRTIGLRAAPVCTGGATPGAAGRIRAPAAGGGGCPTASATPLSGRSRPVSRWRGPHPPRDQPAPPRCLSAAVDGAAGE